MVCDVLSLVCLVGSTRLNGRIAALEAAGAKTMDELEVPEPHPELTKPTQFQATVIQQFAATLRQNASAATTTTTAQTTELLTALLYELQVPANPTSAAASAIAPAPYIDLNQWMDQSAKLPEDIPGRAKADLSRQLLMCNVSTTHFAEVKHDRLAFSPPTAANLHAGKVVGALQYPVHTSTSGAYKHSAEKPKLCATFDFLGRGVSRVYVGGW
jgi:hypothetical protein